MLTRERPCSACFAYVCVEQVERKCPFFFLSSSSPWFLSLSLSLWFSQGVSAGRRVALECLSLLTPVPGETLVEVSIHLPPPNIPWGYQLTQLAWDRPLYTPIPLLTTPTQHLLSKDIRPLTHISAGAALTHNFWLMKPVLTQVNNRSTSLNSYMIKFIEHF